jgi:hypothetical protein
MAVSVSNTCYGIINDAMHDAGLLQEGEEPNSEQLATNMRRLCDIVNLWQTQGLKLFLLEDISIPLVEGQATYSLDPGGSVDMTKPLRGLQAYVLNATNNNRRPLNVLSWDDYMRLSQITDNDGTINSFFINKQAYSMFVFFWNAPDATEADNTAHILIQTKAANPTNLTDDMSFPQEWRIALRWGLADDISTGQPQAIMDRCRAKAEQFRTMLEDWDVEDAPTRFVIDPRMYGNRRRFK